MDRRPFASVGFFEHCEAEFTQPDRYRWLFDLPKDREFIPHGSGLSLAGAGFGPDSMVVGMRHFNRILEFDPETRILHAEAGITLAKLYEFLTPQGFIVAVQPGYPDITLGGCIAGNVHGKNQYKAGCFSDIVQEITLYHPKKGLLTIAANQQAELFNLTCGGFGLTGIIVSAKIRLDLLTGRKVSLSHYPVKDIKEAVTLMTANQEEHDFMYSWHDIAQFGPSMGRGFVVSGTTSKENGYGPKRIIVSHPTAKSFHRPYPLPVFNRFSLQISNSFYYHKNCGSKKTEGLFESLFPFVNLMAYFKAYGPQGFIEHQVLIPDNNIFAYLDHFAKMVRDWKQPFGLASIKKMAGEQTLLRYSGNGIGISLHLPTTKKSLPFLSELDQLNSEHGGVTNPLKDPRLSAAVLRQQFKEFDLFQRQLTTFDPDRLFTSSLSQRLEL